MNRGFVFEFKGQSPAPAAESAVDRCGSEQDHWTSDDLAYAGADSTRDVQHADTEATSTRAANGTARGFVFEFSGQSAAPVVVAQPKPRVSDFAPRAAASESSTRRLWPRMRTVCGLLLALGLFGRGLWSVAHQASVSSPSMRAAHPASITIENLRIGQRVLTDGDSNAPRATAVDPATWRHLRLVAVVEWDDGTRDAVEMETLQPPDWVADHGAEVGAVVSLPIDLIEIGLPEELRGTVVSNEVCPQVQDGPGRVVLATLNHLNRDVMELTLRNHDGRVEKLRPTGFHHVYSESRGEWILAKELRRGEQMRGINGPVDVVELRNVPGVHRVYNMTVEVDHVYRVSSFGVLVHNASSPNKMNTEVLKGWAPRGVVSVHKAGDYPGAKPHVHYSDGTSSNVDGTIHDAKGGVPDPSNAIRNWLIGHDWVPPPRQ